MRKIIVVLLLFVLLILDNACVPFVSIGGFYPSLLFMFAICYSVTTEMSEAVWIGVISGLFQDIYFFHGFGVNALVNMFACIIAAQVGSTIFKQRIIVPTILCFLLSLFKGTLMFIILFILGQRTPIEGIFFNSLYTMGVALLSYKRIYKLSEKPYMKRKWKF